MQLPCHSHIAEDGIDEKIDEKELGDEEQLGDTEKFNGNPKLDDSVC